VVLACGFETCIKIILSLMFLRVGFSQCLQALVHWCGFHAARTESEWCIQIAQDYYCDILLLKQLPADTYLAASDFYSPAHHACTRALSCCYTRLWTLHQICGLPTDQISIL